MTKKSILCILLLMIIIGCSSKEQNNPINNQNETIDIQSIEIKQDEFIYRLVVSKKDFVVGEPIQIYAELEYIGEEKEITISHSASAFSFPMTELTRNYEIFYAMNEPLIHTTIKKGIPLREYYNKSGGYSEEDSKEYKKFINDIWENKFTDGQYIVNGHANFFINKNDENINYNINGKVRFNVNKK